MPLIIRIHPLFFAAALMYLLFGYGAEVTACFAAVILHELAHAFSAKRRGYRFKEIVLMPYGGVLKGGANIGGRDNISVALAGPLFNFLCFFAMTSAWWLFPSLYHYTQAFAYLSFGIGIFNLLPVFPLDGSRIFKELAKNKLKAIKIMRAFGVVFALLLVIAGALVAVFYEFNMSFFVMAIFIFYSAVVGGEKEETIFLESVAQKVFSNM